MVSIRLTKTQEKKIKETGLNRSEFVRRAVDYYLLYLHDPYNNRLLEELEKWIKYKRVTLVTHMGTDVTHMGTDVTHMGTDVTICNTNNTGVTQKYEEKTKPTQENTLKTKLLPDLQMIQRVLNNPLNSDTIPDPTLKLLSKKHDLSKSTIQAWINENKSWIKEGKFSEEE